MAKYGRVRCGRWDGRIGAQCGRVLRDVATTATDRMQKNEKAALRAAVQEFSGKWWEVTRPVAQASGRDREGGQIDIRAGEPWWVGVCRCGAGYAVPAAELRSRTAHAQGQREDVFLTTEDRDTRPTNRP